jgi:hypothetical protein
LRSPETASRRPHVPSSKPTMSKSRQKYRHSHNLPRGKLGASGFLRPLQKPVRHSAAVTPLYGHPTHPSNGFLQFEVTFRISARNAAALPFHPACSSCLRRTGFYAALADRLERVCHATGQDVQDRDPASVQLRPRSRPCWSGLQKPRSAVACGTGSLR